MQVHWWALLGILGLVVAWVLVLVASDPRKEEAVSGRHHWLGEADDDPYEDPLAGEVQHDPEPCTAKEAGGYEGCEDRPPGEGGTNRSEEHTPELQSHSFISYAGFCLKKKSQ